MQAETIPLPEGTNCPNAITLSSVETSPGSHTINEDENPGCVSGSPNQPGPKDPGKKVAISKARASTVKIITVTQAIQLNSRPLVCLPIRR
jgi:hypothetical protein